MQIDIPESDLPRVVIVGGGFGGIALAKALRKAPVQVVLVDKNNYHTFQPLLYQVATAALEADSIAFPIRKAFMDQENFYFRMSEVKEIIPEDNVIITGISHVSYDYLVIATGSQTNYFGNEGLTISAMPMKTIPESLDLRSLILQNFEKALVISNDRKKKSLMNYVIAGGGPTGVELAGALGELKRHILPKDYPELDFREMGIYILQSADRLLPALSPVSSAKAKKYLEELGVTVMLKTRVLDYHGDYVQTNSENDLVAKTLIWTAGVVGNPVSGLDGKTTSKNSRLLVDKFNRIKGHENVFAIGDVAAMITDEAPRGHPMVAPVAIQQARHLAQNIHNLTKNLEMIPFKYNDKGSMATIGKNKAVVELSFIKIQGWIAWFIWIFVHLMSLIGFRNKLMVLINWMRNYINSDRGIRLILYPFVRSKIKKERRKAFEHQQKIAASHQKEAIKSIAREE